MLVTPKYAVAAGYYTKEGAFDTLVYCWTLEKLIDVLDSRYAQVDIDLFDIAKIRIN